MMSPLQKGHKQLCRDEQRHLQYFWQSSWIIDELLIKALYVLRCRLFGRSTLFYLFCLRAAALSQGKSTTVPLLAEPFLLSQSSLERSFLSSFTAEAAAQAKELS
jgi:hypothetical protein